MINFLNLKDYGELLYKYEFDNNGFFIYNNFEKDVNVEVLGLEDQIYTIYVKNKNESNLIKTNDINKPIDTFLYSKTTPLIYNWDSAKVKSKDAFTIQFKYFGFIFEMNFDKNYIVFENKESKIIKVLEIINDNLKLIETYQFTKNGYVYESESESSALYNKNFIYFNQFKKRKNINNSFLDFLPTIIETSIDEKSETIFNIKYDNFGLVSYFGKSDKTALYRYEYLPSEEDIIIKSIYPNIYDIIDPNYIDPTLSLWSCVRLEKIDNRYYLEKYVYKIDKNNLSNLLNHLKSCNNTPIIEV